MSVATAVARALGVAVGASHPIGGGDVGEGWRLELADGRTVYAKTRAGAPPGIFTAEAAGLRWLGAAAALPVPEVLAVADGPHDDPPVLVLPWIQSGRHQGDEEAFGRGLAVLHRVGAASYGFSRNGFIGPLPLDNRTTRDLGRVLLGAAHRALPAHGGGRRRHRPRRRRDRERARGPAGRPGRPARAHRPPARRPLVRQRAVGRRRTAVADRSLGLRRPARGRPRDAGALRRARAEGLRRRTRRPGRCPTATRTGSRSTSSTRCSCTPCSSAAGTASGPSRPPTTTADGGGARHRGAPHARPPRHEDRGQPRALRAPRDEPGRRRPRPHGTATSRTTGGGRSAAAGRS